MKPRIRLDTILGNLGAPFIMLFLLLLLSAAFYLVLGESQRANQLAIFSFYFLVVGLTLQLFSPNKHDGGMRGSDMIRSSTSSIGVLSDN